MNVRELKDNDGKVFSPKVSSDSVYMSKTTTTLTTKIDQVSNSIPTKISDLPNDSGYLNSLPDHTHGEATLEKGGRNFSNGYGPLDMCLVPELGANRFAYGEPSGVSIQYSRDGGSSWSDYGLSNSEKQALFSCPGVGLRIGKADSSNPANSNYLLRITMDVVTYGVYSSLSKFVFYVSTDESTGCYCTIEIAPSSDPSSFRTIVNRQDISGWPGYNVINTPEYTYGNGWEQYRSIRFTFGCQGGSPSSSYPGLEVMRIYGFGGFGWNAPSWLSRYGSIYKPGYNQSVEFPGEIYAPGFYVSSLRSLKENIEPTKVKAVDLINSQEIVDFNYKADEDKVHKIGLIADDSDPLFLDKKGETVDLYNTCGILMKAVQELSAKIKELESKIN